MSGPEHADDEPLTYSFDLSNAGGVVGSDPIVDPDVFPDEGRIADDLERMRTDFSDGDGARITASPAHRRFVSWIEERLRGIDGATVETVGYDIERWSPRTLSLSVEGIGEVPAAGYVPFGEPTGPGGVEGELVHVGRGRPISDADVEGRIAVREFPPTGAAAAAALARAYYVHDPGLTYDWTATDGRYAAARKVMEADMDAAEAAGAAGVVFVLDFPRGDVRLYLRPNFQGVDESFRFRGGVHWDSRGIFVGADEGAALLDLLDGGGSVEARLTVDAAVEPDETRTVIGRLPGESEETVVLTTHTDGVNMVQENGPVGLLAMAEYFAGLPEGRRPERTVEFGFATGHFYGRIGARDYAQCLAGEGNAVLAISPEHFGTLDFGIAEREGPGRRMTPTGLNGSRRLYATESVPLVEGVVRTVLSHDLRRSLVLRAEGEAAVEGHANAFGGEGFMYYKNGIPTVNPIASFRKLLSFGPGMESVDTDLFRREAVAVADLVHRVDGLSAGEIAGGDR